MKKEELQGFFDEMNIKDNCIDIIDNAIGTLMLDPVAAKNLASIIGKMLILIKDAIYWNKFYMFIMGVKKIVDDLGQSVKLSSKLFDNPKNRKQNGMRLLRYVDRADSEQKINDRYAISLESEERQRFYKQKSKKHNMKVDLPTASAEDIQKFFE